MLFLALITNYKSFGKLRPSALRLRTFVSERLSLDELEEMVSKAEPLPTTQILSITKNLCARGGTRPRLSPRQSLGSGPSVLRPQGRRTGHRLAASSAGLASLRRSRPNAAQ